MPAIVRTRRVLRPTALCTAVSRRSGRPIVFSDCGALAGVALNRRGEGRSRISGVARQLGVVCLAVARLLSEGKRENCRPAGPFICR